MDVRRSTGNEAHFCGDNRSRVLNNNAGVALLVESRRLASGARHSVGNAARYTWQCHALQSEETYTLMTQHYVSDGDT